MYINGGFDVCRAGLRHHAWTENPSLPSMIIDSVRLSNIQRGLCKSRGQSESRDGPVKTRSLFLAVAHTPPTHLSTISLHLPLSINHNSNPLSSSLAAIKMPSSFKQPRRAASGHQSPPQDSATPSASKNDQPAPLNPGEPSVEKSISGEGNSPRGSMKVNLADDGTCVHRHKRSYYFTHTFNIR